MKQVLRWLLAIAVVVTLGSVSRPAFATLGDGAATTGSLVTNATSLSKNTAKNLKAGIYGLGGIGAMALGVLAFMGRFQWTWFFGILGGLAMIAGFDQAITYMGGDNTTILDGTTAP
jgi:hypothetical protein